MQKLLNKLIAVVITVMMVSANMAPAIVYAANSLSQDTKTKEENVEFNASINNDYNATLDVNSEGTLLLSLKVSETGYLKDCVVTLKDNNYEIVDNENLNVKSIKDNVIELDEVNAGEVLNVSLPIRIKKEDKVSKDILGKDSTVTLYAIYVNQKGKEKKIEKTLTEHLEWTAELNELVKQDLIRYIKFDNKTMISFKIAEGIENNQMPAESKEIIVNVPSLENNKPSNVIVTGKGISYKYENDVVAIKKENTADSDNKIVWNSQDEYIVTYIYDTQVDKSTIESQVVSKAQVKGNTVEGRLEDYTYDLNEEIGQYVEVEADGTTELSKGYMYANLKNKENNLETAFEVKLKANVGFKDVTDSIKIVESSEMFNSLDASNSITNKKVRVEKDNLVEILGEEGTIKVLSTDGTELGTLTKDNNELEINIERVIIETSKIVKEGDLEIILSKVINSNNLFTKEQISSFTELTTKANVYGYKDSTENSVKEISRVIKLFEPTSNANLDVNVQNLSTVVKNDDVVITATLETDDISDALYSNTKIDITLPKEVKEINIKESGLIYENELQLNNLQSNENRISFELDGTQTKYSTQKTSKGTVIRLVTDLTLDNLAPTSQEMVSLNYTNGETGEAKEIQKYVGIVAPTGFVTTNSIEIDGNKVTSQESNEQIAKIAANSGEKEATISATVVNNLEQGASGVNIVGVIPTTQNKDINQSDLGSNFDTVLTEGINVSDVNAQVFYSENANETVDGSSWNNNYSQSAKAYKIVLEQDVPHGTVINFSYKVKVPANLGYGKTSKATYAVYYNNDAEEGNTKDVVLAKSTGMTTGETSEITTEASLVNLNTDENISNGSEVKEGTIFIYRLKLKNTGKETAKNIKVNINLSEGLSIVNLVKDMTDLPVYQYDYDKKELETTIEELGAEEEKVVEYKLVVTRLVTGEENEVTEQKITAKISSEESEEAIVNESVINVLKGDIEATVTSDKTDYNLKAEDAIEYYLNVKNVNFDKKNNIQATISLPKEIEVVEILNNSGTEYKHDKESNTITYTIPTLDGGISNGIYLRLKVGKVNQDKKVDITAKIKCNEMKEEEKLQTLSYNLISSSIKASMSSNIEQNSLSDTDNLEYYINVTNNSSQTLTVTVNDSIPMSLRVIGYKIQDDLGTKSVETNSRNVFASLQIAPSQTSRLTIYAEPFTLEKGRVSKIENKATIETTNLSVETNTIKHTIVGTSNTSAGSSTSPDGEEGNRDDYFDNEPTEEGTFKIGGTVWLDSNSDGRKDESEDRVSNLTVKLYDKSTGKIALDINGKEQVKTTNEQGRYTFVNVANGNYIVVVEYDNINYGLAKYKLEGLSEAENSDFISTKINEKEVAATDEIQVTDSNTYNIDLGLVKGRIFDLDISKSVKRITVTNTKEETRVYDYEDLEVAKVELGTANVDFATVLVEYVIRIKNEGNIPGYAKSIADYIPEGMTFNSELNSSWYLGKDKVAYNTSLANTIINPGETKEIYIVLSRKMSGENIGTVRNGAEILISYNEYGLEDRDTKNGISQDKVEDKSSADVVIAMATGREIASYTGITLGILALIAFAVYEIKKHVINKLYSNI